MIGATTSQTLDLTLLNKGDTVYGTSTIKVEIGLKIGSTIEYIPMGIYNIDDIEKTDYTIKITSYDNMIKFEKNFTTSLGDTLTLQQVVSELTRITGVEFTGSLPSYTVKKLEGFTCREVLGYVASLCGGNAIITRDGKFTILTPTDVNCSIGTSNYFDYKREESKYKISKISCQVGEDVLSKGSLGADSMELEFENPWVTDSILQDIYTKLNGFEYLGYSMKWQGDLSLDVGDIVTITDKKGVVRKHPILSQKFTYTGGLTSEISAKGETKNKNSFSSSGSTAKKVERAIMELAIINKALIDVAYIGDLTAGNIKFDTASGTIMDLQTLLSKHITGENGQFLNLTTDNVVIANAVIKDAMIENLSLNKLLAGTISTNKFNISSDDGGITIVGPTMQFKDKSNIVRLQLGQDTTGDFNFILRAADGTTTLIDGYGIKERAIADDLIKSNMVAADAIGEKQINYSSLITGLNKDTNTSLIKASKVAIDLTGQSLEVSFNSLKSNVEGINSTVVSNTTAITAVQGEIEGLIKESSITKGDVTTLKDNYTSIKGTVDGINTTVASHTSSLSSLGGKVSTVETKQTSLEQNLEGFKTTVSNTYATTDTLVKNYATKASMELTATQLKLDFSSSGGYNLIKNGNFENGTYGWTAQVFNGENSELSVTINSNEWTINNKKALWCFTNIQGAKERTVRQEIQTVPGKTYTLSYYIAGHRSTKIVRVRDTPNWNDIAAKSYGHIAGGNDLSGWVYDSITFTATSTITLIFFDLRDIGTNVDGYMWLHDVTVVEGSYPNPWIPNKEEVVNGSTVINADGVTIYNGALTIKNNAGTDVIKSDSDGNLTMRGVFEQYSSSGVKSVDIKNNKINLYDWSRDGDLVGGIISVTGKIDDRGKVMVYGDKGNPLLLGYCNLNRDTYYRVIAIDDVKVENSGQSIVGIYQSASMMDYSNLTFYGNTNDIPLGRITLSTANNIALLGRANINSTYIGEMGDSDPSQLTYWGRFNSSGLYVWGGISCSGTKSRLVPTKNFNAVKMNAYETADCYFGDIGEGRIGEDGLCYIYLDPVLLETINTDCNYQVFLTNYGIEESDWCRCIVREKDYFIVKGTPEINFGWEIKAKQKGYETDRLEREVIELPEGFEKVDQERDEIEELTYKYLSDYEKELLGNV